MSTVQVFMVDRLLVGAPVKYQIRSACEAKTVADIVKLTATDWVELATCHLQCWCAVIGLCTDLDCNIVHRFFLL